MKRLLDGEPGADPGLDALARLVEAVDPIVASADSRARVRLRIGGRRHAARRLPGARVMLLIAGNAAAAFAAGAAIEAVRQARRPPEVVTLGPGHSPRPGAASRVGVASPRSSEAVTPAAVPTLPRASRPDVQPPATDAALPRGASAPPVTEVPAPRRNTTRPRAKVPRAAAAPSLSAEPGDGVALVAAGTRALRFDRNADRALVLFDDYVQRYPDGPLIEEAMVRAVEAAQATGDGARPRAQAYLRRFPGGQFRRHVEALVGPSALRE